MPKPYLSVIIPAYNEAKRLPLALMDIDAKLSKEQYSYEILVVDDGSADATAEIVKRFMSLVKHLKLVSHEVNQGKGAAVRRGMEEASGTIRLFTDADNSTSIDQFAQMIPYFKEGYSVVIGSCTMRAASGEPRPEGRGLSLESPQLLWRRVVGKAGNLFIRALVVSGISDTQCGFKAFTEEAAQRIFPLLRTQDWAFDIEALALAQALHLRIKEVSVRPRNSIFSRITLFDYPRVLWETFKIRWWMHKDYYKLN